MSNKEIAKLLKMTTSLLELHGENQFKIRTYSNAVFNIEKQEQDLSAKSQQELEGLDGIGKGLAQSIVQIQEKGSFDVLDELIAKTPEGIVEMLSLKGIGPKKIKLVWDELGVTGIDELYQAGKDGKLEKLKGFGAKTQHTILENLEYLISQRGKALYADAEMQAQDFLEGIKSTLAGSRVEFTGAMRRKLDVIDLVEVIVSSTDKDLIVKHLENEQDITVDLRQSGPFALRGNFTSSKLKWHIRFSEPSRFDENWMLSTGSGKHLEQVRNEETTLYQYLLDNEAADEKSVYGHFNFSFVEPEVREGMIEDKLFKDNGVPELLKLGDLKGPFHNHSNYSDGKNNISDLVDYCREQGYQYLGLSDHSKSAFYANGLQEFRIKQQHEEIDKINAQYDDFKVFKGIESDILNDGSLDYANDVLASFDFIVASVHSNLNMDKAKATQRLLKAIENPYTTFLGHPTGRLLLRRQGYPIDYKKVIDACADNQVIIEINANPWRLDLDWRWVHYALEKDVILSINPDAHEIEGFDDMKYGVFTGRKGGLTKEMTFNAWDRDKVEDYLQTRKAKI